VNYETSNIITYLRSVCKSEDESFFLGSINQGGKFFHSYINKHQLSEIDPVFNLLCLNSFYINEYSVKRVEERLKIIYSLHLDLDGWEHEIPLSHLDILEKMAGFRIR